MTTLFIFLHVAAAIVLLGPVCISTSIYQTQLQGAAQGDKTALGAARNLHNITNTYGYISALVPVLGLAVFLSDIETFKSQVNFHIAILVAISGKIIGYQHRARGSRLGSIASDGEIHDVSGVVFHHVDYSPALVSPLGGLADLHRVGGGKQQSRTGRSEQAPTLEGKILGHWPPLAL